ncbi:MAG: UDP-3-O-acyl-N-acetylglucosamine deacetylase [Phycisphaerales bacterium]|nr:UDP-3-O-acyl-N-acetylglucosamine deacetylase [Phycisphaerales bacterium]
MSRAASPRSRRPGTTNTHETGAAPRSPPPWSSKAWACSPERPARCTIRPANPGEGLAFLRTDLPDAPRTPANVRALCARPVHPAFSQIPPRHTALAAPQRPDAIVYTTEHVLAALAGLGITDATIELDGPELPIADGSAVAFAESIVAKQLPGEASPLHLREPVRILSPDGRAAITAEPIPEGEPACYRYQLDYGPNAPLRPQTAEWRGDPAEFLREIAPARTFSLAAEAAQMQALGLFRSFTAKDLLVIDDSGAPIDNAWRFENEPARHKLLDLIGDLALVGRPIRARITALRAGHAMNHAMAQALAAIPD